MKKGYWISLYLKVDNQENLKKYAEITPNKKVINKTSKEEKESTQKKNLSKGHYKVGNPYKINGVKYIPKLVSEYDEIGIASWYGPKFNLKKTANGEIFDQGRQYFPQRGKFFRV